MNLIAPMTNIPKYILRYPVTHYDLVRNKTIQIILFD